MLFVFVEGYDDKQFVSKLLTKEDPSILIIEYAQMKNIKIRAFIESIRCIPNASYVFIADSDGLEIEEKKRKLIEHHQNLDKDVIYISVYEVESWYYAGISESFSIKHKFHHYQHDTNSLTKEQFNSKLPENSSRILTMLSILDNYDTNLACERNESFRIIYTNSCFKK